MSVQPSGGQTSSPYRGEDRRRVAGPVRLPIGRPFVFAITFLAVLFATVTYADLVSTEWIPQARTLMTMLEVASLMVAVAIAALAFSRWYLTSDAPALWIGASLFVFGIARLGLAELFPVLNSSATVGAWADWLRPASQVIVVLLLVRAVTIVPVSVKISGPRLVLLALAALLGATLLLRLAPPLASLIDGAQAGAPRSYSNANLVGVMPFAYAVLATTLAVQGWRRQRWLFAWLGVALAGLALGDLTRVLAPPPVEAGLLGKEVLRLAALLFGLYGAMWEILYTYRDSSVRLAQSEYTAMTAYQRIREGQALAEERAHEARSALAAIEGATRTLEHYRDRLPPETQAALSTAVSGEIRRLQRLVSVDEPSGEMTAFSLAEALAPIVASERARGVAIDVDVAGDLDVVGRAGSTEQVVQALFDNARKYAAGTRLTVRAERDAGWVILRIEDRGPGVAADQREAIFRRGVRGDRALDVSGSGLGLYVAAQLMRDQGGELWVDDRSGGGASFAVALPADDRRPRRGESAFDVLQEPIRSRAEGRR